SPGYPYQHSCSVRSADTSPREAWGGKRALFPIHPRQVRLRRRAVLPQAYKVLLPDADLGELEEEAVDGVLGDDALGVLQQLVALGEVGGGHDLAPLGLELRRIVVPVVAVAGIAIEIVGLGVGDDGEVVVSLLEHLGEPLRPLQLGDRKLDADLAQLV